MRQRGFAFAPALLALTLALSCGPALAQNGTGSASDFLTQYDVADTPGRQMLEMFIVGQERGLLTANQYLKVMKSKNALYCPPDDIALGPMELIGAVRKLVASDSRTATTPLAVVVLMVLQRNYPCEAPAPSGH